MAKTPEFIHELVAPSGEVLAKAVTPVDDPESHELRGKGCDLMDMGHEVPEQSDVERKIVVKFGPFRKTVQLGATPAFEQKTSQ